MSVPTQPLSDFKSVVYRGTYPDTLCCDSTWRRLPDGSQAVFFLTGGIIEPSPENYVAVCRSTDEGRTWSPPEVVARNPVGAVLLTEVTVIDSLITVYLQFHQGRFANWRVATIESTDNAHTWTEPREFTPLPQRAFVRNLYQTSWGEYLLPYQFYPASAEGTLTDSPLTGNAVSDPQNGVLISQHSSADSDWQSSALLSGARGWSEVNVVELGNEGLAMLTRSDGAGVLLRSDSTDRGRTWAPWERTEIPNPSSKFRLFRLSDQRTLLLHNPTSEIGRRNPLSLWISSNDMQSWDQQYLISDYPGQLAYPDGSLDSNERQLCFAFDHNRHEIIYWKLELPPSKS